MRIIGLGHKKQSGKDTVAAFITKYDFGPLFITTRQSFAGTLKREVCSITGISLDELEKNKSVFRPLLQWWGTEFCRKYQGNDNYWIDKITKTYEAFQSFDGLFIITDVRFLNEAKFVHDNGGLLIKVNRQTSNQDNHPSEIELDDFTDWDYTINNDGTLAELETKVNKLCYELNKI